MQDMSQPACQDQICFGGLAREDDRSRGLRRTQIAQGFRLHTCLDYNGSFELIEDAAKASEKKLKLITKVYFNYPTPRSPRYRSVLDQVTEIHRRLGPWLLDWTLQICAHVPLRALRSGFPEFAHHVRAELGVGDILFETFPAWEPSTLRMLDEKGFREDGNRTGFIYYGRGGASPSMRKAIAERQVPYAVIGLRSAAPDRDDSMRQGIRDHWLRCNDPQFRFTITAASSYAQMDDLLARLRADDDKTSVDRDAAETHSFIPAKDPYGAVRTVAQAMAEPRWIASRAVGRLRKGLRTKDWK